MSVKITQFEAENVKRIRAIQLTPSPTGLTVIGGRNNQGKTSGLDAIMWALGGERYRPSMAQREGSVLPPRSKVELSNGIVAERSGKNGDLKVTDASGRKAGQQLLNSFVEQLALDMPRFMQASNREKADILLRIIGLEKEVKALEQQESTLYNQRHAVGQIADQKTKFAKELPFYPDVPSELISAFDLIQQQQQILAKNGENQRKRELAQRLTQQKQDLKRQLNDLQERYRAVCRDCEIAQKSALDLLDESTDELESSIYRIEETNQKIRTNQDKAKAEREAESYREQYNSLTSRLDEVRQKKTNLLHGAKLPLPGLSVENGELVYQGKPWDCMSGSDQLKVSTAIVRSLKPECGFVLLDRLEQMDLETLQEFSNWMEQEGLQGIATRVSTGGECSIIIEDGCIQEADPASSLPGVPKWKAGEF